MKVVAQTEILHVQNGQFLILAKDSGTDRPTNALNSRSNYRHIDIFFDIDSATDIKGNTYDCATCAIASKTGVLKQGIKPPTYCSFLDFNNNTELAHFGLHADAFGGGTAATNEFQGSLTEMWDSLAAVPDDGKNEDDDEWFIFSVNDNDSLTEWVL